MLNHFNPYRGTVLASLRNFIFWGGTCAILVICISGCGDFFESKTTELESQKMLREITKVKMSEHTNIPLPSVYTDPPKIIEGVIGDQKDAKLFYFSKHHTVDKLKSLVDNQFIKKYWPKPGKPGVRVTDYNSSTNPSTNQLIVRCPSVIDAEQVLAFLENIDVPPVQVKIDCIISEVYADHTLDWQTHLEIQNLFGEGINLVGMLPGAALRDIARSTFGLKTGYVQGGTYNQGTDSFDGASGHLFGALVDVLVSRRYLKILMNPQLEVVNGQTATIVTTESVPLDKITSVDHVSDVVTLTQGYVDVVDSLSVTPHVYADGYIGIETRIVLGSKSTPEGVKQTPIVTKREITIKENRIRSGESLVIGGIRKTEQRSVVRGVPGLKDIPILGVLFSSKDFEERGKEVLFILTPTISTGGIANEQMVADIRRKHARVKSGDSLMDSIKDPFGAGAYTELVEEEAIHAEVERIKAEMDKAAAERKVMDLTTKLQEAMKQVETEKKKTTNVTTDAQAQAQAAKTAADAAKAEADKAAAAVTEAQKQLEAEKAKAAAAQPEKDKAVAAANKTAEEAQAAKAAADKAKVEADAAKAAAEKAKQDAEAKIEAWMKAARERQKKKEADDSRIGP